MSRLRALAFPAVVGALVLALPSIARAELYSYVDDDGVIHFTNLDPNAKPQSLASSNNTYLWSDELGALRRVHRVEVSDYDAIIIEAARHYSLPPALLKAIIAVESSFEAAAVSPAGAQGLMQLVPSTAQAMFVRDPFAPRESIFGGARYVRVLANRLGGVLRLTIAAYNAGPTAIERAGDVPDIVETRRYVQRVLALYKHYLASWPAGSGR